MTSPNDATIVPIALTVDGRRGYTMWAPPWTEDGEEWQAFLGSGEVIAVFANTDDLATYVARGEPNDLVDHPAWDMTQTLPAREFVPSTERRFDVDAVPDRIAGEVSEDVRADVARTIEIVRAIAECTDDGPLMSMLDGAAFAQLLGEQAGRADSDKDEDGDDDENVDAALRAGPDDEWSDVRATVRASWPLLTRRLADHLAWTEGATTPTAQTAEDFWDAVGMLPLTLTTESGTGYTLRCYLDDAAIFLGSDMSVDIFTSPAGLIDYCHSAQTHDLSDLATWPAVNDATLLDVRPHNDERYDLRTESAAAREIALDLAEYCRLDGVIAALQGEEPVDWTGVLTEIESCLAWHD
ncbi:MAG: hypothetical protein DLM59_13440 [Pseudonocardiales bacterium]|nr:MAG: hypothetical protein DLM56_12925 [Pseudonocardiales bacterium]PZS29165.1 MAG: hypothetical protein DLM59_13440 [Pseudonocardiales bacterium]